MTQAQTIVLEYEASVPVTRRHLERIPDNKLSWRPHPKSMSLGELGLHLASTSGEVADFMVEDNVDMPNFQFREAETAAEILAALDTSAAKVRAKLWDCSDEFMTGVVNVVKDGVVLMSFPRAGMGREALLNQYYHHRGQMSVYLRLLNIPVPSSFGPTADETPNF